MTGKEAELTRAGETIRREQQQRQQKDRELAQAQQRLREKVNSVNYIMFHVL